MVMTKLCSECGLQDVVFEHHGVTDFATYNRGTQVIDYLLMDPDLAAAVLHCGYEPFKIHIDSDHRGLFIDLDTDTFFGSNTVPLAKLEHRDLMSKKAHQIPAYFSALTKQLEANEWFQGIQELQECIADDEPNDALAEALDNRRIRSCIHAGKQLKRYPAAPYSPEIARLRNIDNILKLAIHQFTSQYDHTETLEDRQAKLGSETVTVPNTLQECKCLQNENFKLLKLTEQEEHKTAKLRAEHLKSLAYQYEDSGDADAAKCLRQQHRAEATARVWKKCAAACGLTHEGGLSHVLMLTEPTDDPKTCTEWTKVDEPEEMNAILTACNQKHFGQSKNCNLTTPPLDVTMDFEGTCKKAEKLLTGTMETDKLDEATKWLLENMEYVTTPESIDHELTLEEFEGKIKAWKEQTSTSLASNVHLGHAKAYFTRHNLDLS